jgi:hypothetical protein
MPRHAHCVLLGAKGFGQHREFQEVALMLLLEMILLGLATFVALLGFIEFCDWV